MRDLTVEETEQVSGGLDWGTSGATIIALGLSGGLATGLFGLAIGGSMLFIDYHQR